MRIKELRIILVLSLVFVTVVASMIWHVAQLQSDLIESNALNSAKLYTEALTQFRSLYTSEVVERASAHGMDVTHDYASRDNAIPLPATLSMLLGKMIGAQGSGANSRLFSAYPFPWRTHKQMELPNTFDKKAWDHLSEEPGKPYYQFEQQGDKSILQYAIADMMRPQCIACHNTHPDSPKKDWKVGDVRGVLAVTLPLSEIRIQTNAELKNTSITYFLIGLGIMASICIVIIKLRNQSQELKAQVLDRTAELNAEVNEHQSTITELTDSEERFRLGIEASPAAMIMIEESGKIIKANHQAEKLFGYTSEKLIENSIEMLIPKNTRGQHLSLRSTFMENPSPRTMAGREIQALNAKGDIFPVEVGLSPIHTHTGLITPCSIFDLTERKEYEATILEQAKRLKSANELLSEQATTDSLTGAANRRKLFSQQELLLALSRRKGLPISILMADIDYFKKYNDDFGHTAGDEALRTVAQTLIRESRDTDLVARYGGEEFAILLAETGPEGALCSGEKMRKAVEDISSLERKITMSFGVATIIVKRDDEFDVERISKIFVETADKALYHSKKNGRNRVTHFDNIDDYKK